METSCSERMISTDQILEVLKSSILEVMPELAKLNILSEMSLKELGLNSVDRAEIIMLTLSKLKLNIPLVEFANARNISDILDILDQ